MDLLRWLRAQWDRVGGYALIALGVIALTFGYFGVSGSAYTPEALSYLISGGLGGLLLLGFGTTLVVSADLRDEWRKLDRVEQLLEANLERGTLPAPSADHGSPASPSEGLTLTDAPAKRPRPLSMAAAQRPQSSRAFQPTTHREGIIRDPARAVPFSVIRLELTAVTSLVATAVLVIGWYVASGTSSGQVAVNNTALATLGVLGVAGSGAGLVTGARHSLQRRRREILRPLTRLLPEQPATSGADELVADDANQIWHRRGCPALGGGAPTVIRDAQATSSLRACAICAAS